MVFHRIQTPALTQAIADADGTFFLNEMWTPMAGAFHTTTVFQSVVVTDLRTEGGPQFTAATGFPAAGTSTSTPMAPQISAMVSWRTLFRARGGRGRSYLPPMTVNVNDGGVTAAMLVLINEFAQDVVDANDFLIVSRYSGTDKTIPGKRPKPIPRIGGPVTNLVIQGAGESRWRTQRRRQVQ